MTYIDVLVVAYKKYDIRAHMCILCISLKYYYEIESKWERWGVCVCERERECVRINSLTLEARHSENTVVAKLGILGIT